MVFRDLLPIGAFARLCRLSVKQLRHYDEVGLLSPASIDPATGYRYYSRDHVRDAMVIALLRGLDVPLAAIGRVLAGGDDVRAAVLRAEQQRLDPVRLVDSPEFPARYRGEALAQNGLLELIRDEAVDLDWTYISPPVQIESGERTGTYRRGDHLLIDAAGNSAISAEDHAVALVDELETGRAIKRRITVAH